MEYPSKLSRYVSFREGTKSSTAIRHGIENVPDEAQLKNMIYVAENVFDPIREWLGGPLGINSFLRGYKVNKLVGGSMRSYHVIGAAIDIDADVYDIGTNKKIFDFVRGNLDYSELIWEYGTDREPAWVHVALQEGNVKPENVKQAYYDIDGIKRIKRFDLY